MRKKITLITSVLIALPLLTAFMPAVLANTYYWWDNVYFVGSGQYIKYPHADRDYYAISPFSFWSKLGTMLIHNQIDQGTSRLLNTGGPALIGAAIGAAIGLIVSGPAGGAVGAVVGAVIAVVLTWVTGALWLDEWDCIWWYTSNAFVSWCVNNWLAIIVGGTAVVMAAFLLYGYLRVGTVTFYDAIGRGGPAPPPPPPSGGGGGGGGGCPTLFSWTGTDYTEEQLLNIHASDDVTLNCMIQYLELTGRTLKLQLRELDAFTSHIDRVKVYAIDSNLDRYEAELIYAQHSSLGPVTYELRYDDGLRTNLAPEQQIALQFMLPTSFKDFEWFAFEINGYNMKLMV